MTRQVNLYPPVNIWVIWIFFLAWLYGIAKHDGYLPIVIYSRDNNVHVAWPKQKLSHFYYFSRTLLEKKWQLHTASQMKNNSDSFIPANPWDHDPTTRARIMVWRVSYITILSFPPLRVVVHESLARAAPWMTIDQRGVLAAHGLLPPVDIGWWGGPDVNPQPVMVVYVRQPLQLPGCQRDAPAVTSEAARRRTANDLRAAFKLASHYWMPELNCKAISPSTYVRMYSTESASYLSWMSEWSMKTTQRKELISWPWGKQNLLSSACALRMCNI